MPEMKNSGIEWIGQIPKDWEIIKIGGVYSLRNTKVSDIYYPPLSVTMKGILPQLESAAKTNDHDNRKLVKKGDFAINSRSDRRGSCGISNYDGSVSLINTVLKPNRKMVNGYYNWLFHTTEFADEFYKWGHGIVDDLWTTNWQDMKKMSVPYPSVEKQELISSFLNTQCSEIESLYADIEKQVDVLEQYKKSVITEAVTKGLDPNVEMKDSGIEWVGKIPKDWKILRIKYLVNYNEKTLNENELDDFEFDYIDIGSVTYGKGIEQYQHMFFKDAPSRARRLVDKGDIILSTVRTYLKAVAVIPVRNYPVVVSTGFIVFKSNGSILQSFLSYLVQSHYFVSIIESKSYGVSYPAISSNEVVNTISILPTFQEQQQIADYLDSKCAEIDSAIADKKKQLETLEAYKKSLIYEYVTGKKEVPA